ncbi:hypothetical protein ACWEOW_06880 [Monashia sp. NPDC004114]
MPDKDEPQWLTAMRSAARQRPRTQFQKIRWAHLQNLLREYDMLWNMAPEQTRSLVEATRRTGDWSRYEN